MNGDRIDRKRRNAFDHGEDLIFEIGLVMEGGSNERLGFNKVHGVDEVFAVEGDRERMDDRADLQASNVENSEFRPRRHLEGDHITVLDALFTQP